MKEKILSYIHAECPWRDTLHWFDSIDSTNTQAAQLAKQGAPHGTVLIAGHQTGGKGRLGRSFLSPAGMGVYLSVILRPRCAPAELMHLTCAAAVAMCEAVEQCAGVRPSIKWTNDLVFGKKKLGGILTALNCSADGTSVDYAIIGIGINCRQAQFPDELKDIATSLSAVCGKDIDPHTLAAKMVEYLASMDEMLFAEKTRLMDTYRANCITLGKDIVLLRGDEKRYGKALDLDEDGALLVEFSDGHTETVSSGEVSVRSMYGYL